MKTSTKLILTGTATLVAAAAIFGTVQIVGALNQLSAPVKLSTAVAPTATKAAAAPIVGDLNGDGVLDGWEKDQLARQSFTVLDGTSVQLPAPGQPLPASVVATIQAKVLAAAGHATTGSAEASGAQDLKAMAAVKAQSDLIGVRIIPVTYAFNGGTGTMQYCVGLDAAGAGCSDNEAGGVAIANTWIGARSDRYTVVVFK